MGEAQTVCGNARVETVARCTHTQDRQSSRHEQSGKVWVLWTRVGSHVCE